MKTTRGRLLGYLGSRSDPTADVAAVRELLQRGPLRYRKPSREELEEWRQLSDDGTTIYGARYVPCQATPRAIGAAAALALILLPGRALAWGKEGHQIVALIARSYLSAPVREKVDALLGDGHRHAHGARHGLRIGLG